MGIDLPWPQMKMKLDEVLGGLYPALTLRFGALSRRTIIRAVFGDVAFRCLKSQNQVQIYFLAVKIGKQLCES